MGSHVARSRLGTRRYRKISSRLDHTLKVGNFEQAARYGVSLAALASSKDTLAILTSAVQIFKEGKETGWVADSSKIVKAGIRRAEKISEVRLTTERKELAEAAFSRAVNQVKSERRG